MRKILILLFVLFVFPRQGYSDVIIFKSGSAKVGIIEEETSAQVKLRVKDVVVGISRTNIEKIEYSTQAENDKLKMKWKEDKERQDEERRKKREAEEKFEAEQKAKGLIKVGGEWISPGEAEARRQQQLQEQVQRQQQAEQKNEEVKPQEQLELPEDFKYLPEEQKNAVLEELKRQQKIQLGQVQLQTLGNQIGAKGAVTNGSDVTASNVVLEIKGLDENGDVVDMKTATVYSVKPGESSSFYMPLRGGAAVIKKAEARVISVSW
jgi:hypothetical protein